MKILLLIIIFAILLFIILKPKIEKFTNKNNDPYDNYDYNLNSLLVSDSDFVMKQTVLPNLPVQITKIPKKDINSYLVNFDENKNKKIFDYLLLSERDLFKLQNDDNNIFQQITNDYKLVCVLPGISCYMYNVSGMTLDELYRKKNIKVKTTNQFHEDSENIVQYYLDYLSSKNIKINKVSGEDSNPELIIFASYYKDKNDIKTFLKNESYLLENLDLDKVSTHPFWNAFPFLKPKTLYLNDYSDYPNYKRSRAETFTCHNILLAHKNINKNEVRETLDTYYNNFYQNNKLFDERFNEFSLFNSSVISEYHPGSYSFFWDKGFITDKKEKSCMMSVSKGQCNLEAMYSFKLI